MSKIDTLNELLGQYCAGGYSGGFYGEANARWVEDNFGEIARVYDVYRLGPTACLLAVVEEDTPRLDELIEVLEGLDDYPLIDDSYLQELISKDEEREVGELANAWEVAEECVWKALEECGAQLDWEQDYVYLANYYAEDVEAKAKELELERVAGLQTWETHYYAGADHTMEVCEYCKEWRVVA